MVSGPCLWTKKWKKTRMKHCAVEEKLRQNNFISCHDKGRIGMIPTYISLFMYLITFIFILVIILIRDGLLCWIFFHYRKLFSWYHVCCILWFLSFSIISYEFIQFFAWTRISGFELICTILQFKMIFWHNLTFSMIFCFLYNIVNLILIENNHKSMVLQHMTGASQNLNQRWSFWF